MKTKNKYTGLTFARKCDECSKGMNEGYVIYQGERYYCSDECLNQHFGKDDFFKLYNDNENESYWTEWEEDEHEYRELSNGELEEIN